MKRITSQPSKLTTLVVGCDAETTARIDALAARDGVSRSRVLRELIAHALPEFEGGQGEADEASA